jgi:CheY-like chemotaxis protein
MTAEPLRVLLVEDNAADARLVEEMLKGSGRTPVSVVHAVAVAQALAVALAPATVRPDLAAVGA